MASGPGDTGGAHQRAVTAAAQRLRVDDWTAQVVVELQRAGLRPILLKGPATARWLYPDEPGARSYWDVDLLVAPGELGSAEDVLARLGFVRPPRSLACEGFHAQGWSRAADGALVDLHRSLHGMEGLPDDQVWKAVTTGAEAWEVGGVQVEIPGPTLRTLQVVLHVRPSDEPGSQAWQDLLRARERVDGGTWQAAAALARRLGIEAEMGVRLRMVPECADLADELALPRGGPRGFYASRAVANGDVAPQTRSLVRLGSLPGVEAKLGYVRHKLVPPAAFMRERSALARRGAWGLAGAYAARIGWCLRRMPGGVEGFVRLRRQARSGPRS